MPAPVILQSAYGYVLNNKEGRVGNSRASLSFKELSHLTVAVFVCATSRWVAVKHTYVQSTDPSLYGVKTKPSSTSADLSSNEN
jgi:hypothetical protein